MEQEEVSSSNIDVSLIEHALQLTYEERLEAHEAARQLVRDLQEAGQKYYERQPQIKISHPEKWPPV